jgi:uncharacterized 2Fe-2S/4Fe-4S cluster protein (DUF4445 family)
VSAKELKVTFQPTGRTVYVLSGTPIMEAAGRAGIILQSPCGGKGTCGKCRVRLVNYVTESDEGTDGISDELVHEGYRLACRTHVTEDVVVEIPKESLFEATEKILTGDTGQTAVLHPVVRKQFFDLGEPDSHNAGSDSARLQEVIGDVDIPFAMLQKLPLFLRANSWQGTAVVIGSRLAGLEVGNTADKAYGIAMDLGTTTVVATLFDLTTGAELALVSAMNPQVSYGDDVIARISKVRDNHGALAELQHVVIKAINGMIQTLTEKAAVPIRQVYEITVAGNSTMQQILCGLDPSALGEVPFVQVFDAPLRVPAATLGVSANPGGEVFVFPQVGGFVGGDTVAGVLAAAMDRSDEPVLLVDIGTNGEIVLAHNGKLQATSTAAGPAFEGARIVQGMRATAGAIEKIVIDDDVVLNIIGNAKPAGLCGTALIDAVAELLSCGLIDETGRILEPDEAPDEISDVLRHRLIEMDGQVNFLLASGGESSSGEPIYLWQKDVRELQLASGAIRAGINILLRRAGLEAADLGAVLLAGAFGNFIRRSNARRIGLLPQIACNRIRFIGNAASLGAKLALLSADERERASGIRAITEHVDLSLDPEFQMEFGMAMMFPENDGDSCRDA